MDPMAYLGVKGENGRFQPDSPKAFSLALARFQAKEKIKVTFEKYHETRSNAQNRAFWGIVVRAFSDYMGYRFNNERDRNYVKDCLLELIGHTEAVAGLNGEMKVRVLPTSKLSKPAFKDLYERCQEEGAKLGVFLPDPGTPEYMGAKGAT